MSYRKIKEIFLDLDDVLAQMTIAGLSFLMCDIEREEQFNPDWGFDIIRAANCLHKTERFHRETFWKLFPAYFWRNLKPTGICCSLIQTCANLVGQDHVFVLTAPTREASCVAGKIDWCRDNLPPWLQRQVIFTGCKHVCSKPSALLIDDSDQNCSTFRTPPGGHGKGGSSILFPRPWNTNFTFCSSRLTFLQVQLRQRFPHEDQLRVINNMTETNPGD